MEPLFYRHGGEFTGKPELNDKGKPVTTVVEKCSRCGGAGGAAVWAHTGWTCYRCGGRGTELPKAVKLYTKAQIDKLNATAAKREAKKQAAREAEAARIKAEQDARRGEFLKSSADIIKAGESLGEAFIDEMLRQCIERAAISQKQIDLINGKIAENARKAASAYVGAIGERRDFVCHLEAIRHWENEQFRTTTYLHILRDAEGHTIKYKGSRLLGGARWIHERGSLDEGYYEVDKAVEIRFKATVSGHEEYKGEKQTIVSRPKVEEKNEQS